MPTVTLCSWNVEWMNDWFGPDGEPAAFRPTFRRDDDEGSTDVVAGRVAAVITAIDPAVLALQEAPSRPEELALFIERFLSDGGVPRYRFVMGDSGGAQKLALLYKPGVAAAQLAPRAEVADLIDPWEVDIDGDAVLEPYAHTRTPLVVRLTLDGRSLLVVVAHLKSNFVNNGRALWEEPTTRQNYVVAALKSRRRISAEAMRIRFALDRRLRVEPNADIVALGDLNDGPGLDFFEERYLTHNLIDILIGSAYEPERLFLHAQHEAPAAERFSAVFDDFVTDEEDKRLLLDHILLSPGLRSGALRRVPDSGAVFHSQWAAQVDGDGDRREDRPSDHRPVGVQLRT